MKLFQRKILLETPTLADLECERNEARKALQEIASLDTSQDASPQQCAAVLLAMNALGK